MAGISGMPLASFHVGGQAGATTARNVFVIANLPVDYAITYHTLVKEGWNDVGHMSGGNEETIDFLATNLAGSGSGIKYKLVNDALNGMNTQGKTLNIRLWSFDGTTHNFLSRVSSDVDDPDDGTP